MKASILISWICYWVDYSNKKDCLEVLDISKEDFEKVSAWTHKLEKVPTEEWLKRLLVEYPIVEQEIVIDWPPDEEPTE